MTYELGMVNGKGVLPNVLERKISYFTADALICISENTKKDLLGLFLFCILAIIWVSVWYEELHQVNPLITKLLYGVLCAIIVYSM
jgi:hypothetical protein